MNRFWDNIILPIIKNINARYIVEIGSYTGLNTQNILEYCMDHDAHMTAIDPLPKFDIDEFKTQYGDKFEIYKDLSLSRLPLLENYDVILIDGDHNWYTVYNELKIIEKKFKDKKFPIVFLHDTTWPYGRRDLYYNPENIPEAHRQPYKKLGMYPGQTNLKEKGGLNTHLYNSVYENNLHNGILTAVEDFLDESNLEFSFDIINAFHGLGILYPKNNEIEKVVKSCIKKANLLKTLEEERVKLQIGQSELINQQNLLKKVLDKNKIKLDDLKNQLIETENQLEVSNRSLQEKETKNQTIQNQLTQTENQLKLANAIQEKEKEIQTIQNQLTQTENQLKLANAIQEKETENQTIQNQLTQTENQLTQTENQLKTSNQIIQQKNMLIDTIEGKERSVEKLSSQIISLKASFYEMNYLNNNDRSITQRLISKFPSLYILLKINKSGIKNTLINIKGYKAIKNNHLLNIGYYLKNNGDIKQSGTDPILHYIYHGFKEGRKPNPSFDGDYYLKKHSDVRNSKLNPLVHYSLYGLKEERETQISLKGNYNSNVKSIHKQNILPNDKKKTNYDEILNKNKSIINLHPFKEDNPLISIIIVNMNGLEHLKRLFKDFQENIQYPSYEILVVDNASTDKSIEFLEYISNDLPIKIIKNTENKSFSKANNQAAKIAKGEYLLLLNNDVEPTYGWLNQMMQTALKREDIGAVGAKLVYPDCSKSIYNKNNSFKVQHAGIAFKEKNGLINPYNKGNGLNPFDPTINSEKITAGVTAAVLLVKKDTYLKIGGLDEKYNYGYEDVDFCLKLLKNGYKNVYCPEALIFHYEHGTDESNEHGDRVKRHIANENILLSKWNSWLHKLFLMDKLNHDLVFSEKPLKITFIVTETGKNVSAGDYFTALEFGEALKKIGWDVSFLSQKGPENWYEIKEDVDVLISLLPNYNPHEIKCSNGSLIKIAWPRNWFDKWASKSSLQNYNIILASSKTACEYIKNKTGLNPILMPIGTNPNRFKAKKFVNKEYLCDYCFTGSYWNDPREIIEMLDPESIPYTFKLYGKNWEKIEKLQNYYQGFINYADLPEVYNATKIVIDDANRVTKSYGAINSRVYDAISSGALVLTNGEIGSKETFEGKLPVYRTKKELKHLIEYYLVNEDARIKKVEELQKFVLENHTYDHRAQNLKDILKEYVLRRKIAIKIPSPNWEEVQNWGDYHLALGLKKELEKKDCDVILQILPEWEKNEDEDRDIVIVLRGLSRYKPKKQHFNIMWNISHPDKVSIKEYNQYDHVFIASALWAQKIAKETDVPVNAMLQCTDPELFYPEPDDKYKHDLLFVGNSRKVYRKIIKDLLPTDKDLAVYGTNWKGLIPDKYIKGEHIPNNELRKAYSSCKILLNDHWDDMREKGFISNRLFDGFAAGAFIISDKIKGTESVFNNTLITYETPHELHNLINQYLDVEKTVDIRNIVIKQHTFKNRAEQILEVIDKNMKICKEESDLNFPKQIKQYSNSQIDKIMDALDPNNKVSIIVPIYNAYEDTKKCIKSVLENTKIPYELILIDDCSPDKRIGTLLNEIKKTGDIKIIRNKENKGFVKSINIGIKNSKGDVVLLNSDTIVTSKWLQKLIITAYSDKKIGTVTPLSNAAGAFSVPEIGKDNKIPAHLTLNEMASLVEKVSENVNMKVPTGNGFCMFIKRETINNVGLFDEKNFGKGYGEENDFCMRAIEKSWTNIIDDSTYIYHKGSSSFSNEKEELMNRNRTILDKKHPSYTKKVHEFLSSSELKFIQENIKTHLDNMDFEQINQLNKKRLLCVLHQGGGGTPIACKDIITHVEKSFECYILTSTTQELLLWEFEDGKFKKIKVWKIKSKWSAKEFYNNEFRNIYFNVLKELNIDIVHIHHLFKHSFDLPIITKKLGIPTILSFHDFYFVCPSIHLLNGNNEYCSGKCTSESNECKIPTELLNDLPPLKTFVNKWRKEVSKVFDNCSYFIATTESTKEIYTTTYPQLSKKPFEIIEHGIDFKEPNDEFESPSTDAPTKILVPGNMDNHKGSNFIKDIKKEDKKNLLEFHFMGTITPDLESYGIYHGPYERKEFCKIVNEIKPSFIGIFSIWPETYCYTLSEAWTCGIPVLTTKIGAQEERVNKNGAGWFLDHKNPLKAYNEIIRIIKSPEEYRKILKQVKRVVLRNTKEMAYDYECVYWQNLNINEYSDIQRIYRVALFVFGKNDTFPPTAHIRLLSVFHHPSLYGKIVPYVINENDLKQINKRSFLSNKTYDCIIVQRDVLDEDFSKILVNRSKEQGIKLIYEIDDDLLNIDKTHPEYKKYLCKRKVIEYLIKNADLITVSTDYLKKQLSPLNNNVQVIRNALNEQLWFNPPNRIRDKNNEINIGYMGSFTHDTDLLIVKEVIKNLQNKFAKKNIKFNFYVVGGVNANNNESWFKKVEIPSNKNHYPQFVQWLKKISNWDFAIVPLADTNINQSKSEIKYLDYTALNLAAVYSDVGPYPNLIKNGFNGLLVKNNDTNQWESQINKLINNPKLRKDIRINAQKDLMENYLIKYRTKIWYDTIKMLVDKNKDNSIN